MTLTLAETLPQPRAAPRRNYLSYSAVSTFQACPLRYYFRYVQGLPEQTVSSSLVFGSAIHACLQYHFECFLEGRQAPTLAELMQVYEGYWATHQDQDVHFACGEDRTSLTALAARMLRAFQTNALSRPQGAIIGVEEELRGPLAAGMPDVLARLDLLLDSGDSFDLIDIKTSRSRWSSAQVEEKAGQLLLYHELVQHLAGDRPVRLSFAVLTKTKLPELLLLPVPADAVRLQRMRRMMQQVWRAIQAGHFYPHPSAMNCPTCPFQKPCQAWGS
jgi:putative RecB family exonuclease